jgi:hypothetical protein
MPYELIDDSPRYEILPSQGSGSAAVDAGNAVGTGYFRGLTRLAGLPVDTIQNIVDLGKAGVGSAYIAATGKAPPDWLQLQDRSNVLGTGDNLLKNVRKIPLGSAVVDPINPQYEGGYLQNAGGGLTAVMNPNSGAQAINQAILGVTGNTGAKLAYDTTGNPALAVTANLLPVGAQQAATAGVKYAVRGGEEGRQQMAQRIQDLKNAGIANPTVGLASGNSTIGGIENILQGTPGAVNIMRNARDQAIGGLQKTLDEAANLASQNRGTAEAGASIQRGIRDFKDQFKGTQEQLYNNLDNYIPGQHPATVANTKNTLADLNSPIVGAPQLSKQFQNSRIMAIEDAIKQDTAGSPATVMVYQQPPQWPIPGPGGVMPPPIKPPPIQVVVPEGPPTNNLPFEAVKKTRTLVGNEIADNSLMSGVPQSKWKPLYGALSQDIGATAASVGPDAQNAFNRANDYTRAGMARLERIAPFAQYPAPEQAFTAVDRTARENVSTLQALKKSLPQSARGDIAGTIIDRLGTATPGQQNAQGTAWSPETFLTNWNRMTPKARDELFSGFPNASQVQKQVASVADATSMMRDSSKLWANPSGTGANVMARGTLGLVGLGGGAALSGLLNPLIPLGAGAGLLGANRLASGLTNPDVVAAMARQSYMTPELLNGQYRAMLSNGLLGNQAQNQ